MKSQYLPILALVLSAVVSAYSAPSRTTITFHFDPSLGQPPSSPAAYVPGGIFCDGIQTMICTIVAERSTSNTPVFPAGTNPVNNPVLFQTSYQSGDWGK